MCLCPYCRNVSGELGEELNVFGFRNIHIYIDDRQDEGTNLGLTPWAYEWRLEDVRGPERVFSTRLAPRRGGSKKVLEGYESPKRRKWG